MTKYCTPAVADLHNHTTYSDGELTPAELVKNAQSLKLEAVAVTDHDTIEGLDEALSTAESIGMELVCGLEVTLRFTEEFFRGSLHLLLYFSKTLARDPAFQEHTAKTLAHGRGPALNASRLEAINQWFGPGGKTPKLPENLTEDHLHKHGHRISRRHFAKALNDLGITDRNAVNEIIGNDSVAYVPSGLSMSVLKDYLTRWPVVRIFAHPAAGSFPGDSHYKEVLPPLETVEILLPKFLDLGLDGFEICYPGHTSEHMERLESLRKQHNLPLVTGGSDSHDTIHRHLGVCGVNRCCLELLNNHIRRKSGI